MTKHIGTASGRRHGREARRVPWRLVIAAAVVVAALAAGTAWYATSSATAQTDRDFAATLRISYESHPDWLPAKEDSQYGDDARDYCELLSAFGSYNQSDTEALDALLRGRGYPGSEFYTGGDSVASVFGTSARRSYCPELDK